MASSTISRVVCAMRTSWGPRGWRAFGLASAMTTAGLVACADSDGSVVAAGTKHRDSTSGIDAPPVSVLSRRCTFGTPRTEAGDDPKPRQMPRAPILLLHGLLGFDRLGSGRLAGPSYFNGVVNRLEASGARVQTLRVSATGSIEQRAASVKAKLDEIGEPVVIVAHSLGGLDARWAISRLGAAKQVKALVTVGTPHRGTAVADYGIQHTASLQLQKLLESVGIPTRAFFQLTREHTLKFNLLCHDRKGVLYASIAGARPAEKLSSPLGRTGSMLEREELAARRMSVTEERSLAVQSDGLVSVSSAAWGEYLGAVDADHWEQIGWRPLQLAEGAAEHVVAALRHVLPTSVHMRLAHGHRRNTLDVGLMFEDIAEWLAQRGM